MISNITLTYLNGEKSTVLGLEIKIPVGDIVINCHIHRGYNLGRSQVWVVSEDKTGRSIFEFKYGSPGSTIDKCRESTITKAALSEWEFKLKNMINRQQAIDNIKHNLGIE